MCTFRLILFINYSIKEVNNTSILDIVNLIRIRILKIIEKKLGYLF